VLQAAYERSAKTPFEVHPLTEDADDDDAGCRPLKEQDIRPDCSLSLNVRFGGKQKFNLRRYRSDGELAVAGANLVAGKSASRAFGHGLGGALTAAEVCLRLIEAEPLRSRRARLSVRWPFRPASTDHGMSRAQHAASDFRQSGITTADYFTPARHPANSHLDNDKLRRVYGFELPASPASSGARAPPGDSGE
jgi:hypothetical protein